MPVALTAVLYGVVLVTAYASAQVPEPPAPHPRLPLATSAALLVVGVPTALQLTVAPALLQHLQRDWPAIGSGQLWRLGSSLVVQDGGLPGTVFNLVSLALVGTAAERRWGARRWLVVALGAGVGAQLWGALVQPVGAGNSVAVFGLAGSLAVLALRRGDRVQQLLGAGGLLAATVLLVAGDLHGGAVAIGGALAVLLLRRAARRPVAAPRREAAG